MNPPPASRSGRSLFDFLGFLSLSAGFGFGPSLHLDPSVSLADQFGHRQAIVAIEAIGFLPIAVVGLVAAGGNDAVQLPLSPVLRQIVTCKAPSRILCAGLDMMLVSFFWFQAPTIGALRKRPHRRLAGLLPTGRIVRPVPVAT